MSRPQFTIRTLLWLTLVVAAFTPLLLAVPFEHWPDAGKGTVILVASLGGAIDLLKDQGRRNWKTRTIGLIGYLATSAIGLVGIIAAIL